MRVARSCAAFAAMPAIIQQNIGGGFWVDFSWRLALLNQTNSNC